MMPMRLSSIRRLANAAIAFRGKGHHPGDLLDFELFARPTQALAHDTGLGHHRTGWAAGIHTTRSAASTALAPTPASRTATRSACGILGPGGIVELGLKQALRIVAIRFVEFPAAAEIDAGGGCRRKFFACTACKTYHRRNHDDSHPAIL